MIAFKLSSRSNAELSFGSRLQGVCWTIRRRGARPMCLRVILQWVASTEDCQEVTQPATTSVIPTSSRPASYAPHPAAFTVYQVSIQGVLFHGGKDGARKLFNSAPMRKRSSLNNWTDRSALENQKTHSVSSSWILRFSILTLLFTFPKRIDLSNLFHLRRKKNLRTKNPLNSNFKIAAC